MKKIAAAFLALTLLLSGMTAAHAAGPWTDGTYEGDGYGFIGPIRVSVEISGGAIADIDILETSETNMEPPMNFWDMAHPEMVGRILEAQSTEVDAVSGATFASQGIKDAMDNALAKATGGSGEEDAVFEMSVTAKNRYNESPADAPVAEMLQSDAVVERRDGKYYATITFGSGTYWWYALTGADVTTVKALAANGASYLPSLSDSVDEGTGLHSFTIPITSMDAQEIQLDTAYPIIGTRYLRLFFTERQPQVVDKSLLFAAITQAEALEENLYTADSWEGLAQALATARQVYGDGNATAASVAGAAEALGAARAGLVLRLEDDCYWAGVTLLNSWNEDESAASALLGPVAKVETVDSRTWVTLRFVPDDYNEYRVDGTQISAVRAGGVAGEKVFSDEEAGVRDFRIPVQDPVQPIELQIDSRCFLDDTLAARLVLDGRMDEQPADPSVLRALAYRAEGVYSGFYTEQSYAALSAELQKARDLLAETQAGQNALDAQATSLRAGLEGLAITGNPVEVDSLGTLRASAAGAPDGAVVDITGPLEADGGGRVISRSELTVQGNGHTLDGMGLGGFFYVQGGKLTLRDMTITNAKYMYDGLYNGKGSAVLAENGNLRMENCTVVNSSSSWGNVYVNTGCAAEIVHCTFAGNWATGGASLCLGAGASALVANSILVGGASMYEVYCTGDAQFTDGGYNLVTSTNFGAQGLDETTVVDRSFYPADGWLTSPAAFDPAEKGLPLLPVENSPALDKIPADNPYLLSRDQKGDARPRGGRGDIGAYENPVENTEPESLRIDAPALVVLRQGKTLALEATIEPAAATGARVNWRSANEAVARVDENGIVTGVKPGVAVIEATTENGKTHAVTLRVTR